MVNIHQSRKHHVCEQHDPEEELGKEAEQDVGCLDLPVAVGEEALDELHDAEQHVQHQLQDDDGLLVLCFLISMLAYACFRGMKLLNKNTHRG